MNFWGKGSKNFLTKFYKSGSPLNMWQEWWQSIKHPVRLCDKNRLPIVRKKTKKEPATAKHNGMHSQLAATTQLITEYTINMCKHQHWLTVLVQLSKII